VIGFFKQQRSATQRRASHRNAWLSIAKAVLPAERRVPSAGGNFSWLKE
jgi:hypothetical protein